LAVRQLKRYASWVQTVQKANLFLSPGQFESHEEFSFRNSHKDENFCREYNRKKTQSNHGGLIFEKYYDQAG